MQNVTEGLIVKTISGHDKNEVFAIIDIKDNFAYLVNGKNRSLENPKKKSFKHIIKIGESKDLKNLINNKQISNSNIIKYLKDYT